ncbi:MAG TPA: hypothetical protein VK157_06010, partial [Phycisphaerales bacterium]|nr:hypothetical protein [Phycisphaerales bacterium]
MSRKHAVVALLGVASVCASASADFTNAFGFGQPPEMVLTGDALFDQYYAAATTTGDQRGAIWYNVKQDAVLGFRGTFEFRINSITAPGFIRLTVSADMSLGAEPPGTSAAAMTTSAEMHSSAIDS